MLVVGGVPEHFNLPWRAAEGTHFWKAHGLDVKWVDQPGGTGQMLAALETGDLDLAVLLTEGLVKRIATGLQAKIVTQFISSPLRWGIHVAVSSELRNVRSLRGARFAITRRGSGSHLMAYVLCNRLGFDLDDSQWVVVGNLDGARSALQNGGADVLLWDRFMLSPLVADRELRRIGEQPTPWPSFVVAARDDVLLRHPQEVQATCSAIAELATTLRHDPRTKDLAVEFYGLRREDTEEWLTSTNWDSSPLQAADVEHVQRQLKGVGIVDAVLPSARFLAAWPEKQLARSLA